MAAVSPGISRPIGQAPRHARCVQPAQASTASVAISDRRRFESRVADAFHLDPRRLLFSERDQGTANPVGHWVTARTLELGDDLRSRNDAQIEQPATLRPLAAYRDTDHPGRLTEPEILQYLGVDGPVRLLPRDRSDPASPSN